MRREETAAQGQLRKEGKGRYMNCWGMSCGVTIVTL